MKSPTYGQVLSVVILSPGENYPTDGSEEKEAFKQIGEYTISRRFKVDYQYNLNASYLFYIYQSSY